MGKGTAPRQQKGKASTETRYYLMSHAFPPERFGVIVRGHWNVENGLHWTPDVVFNEDQAGNRKDHCAENLDRLEPSKGSMRGKPRRAG